jgi:hypothetical protein
MKTIATLQAELTQCREAAVPTTTEEATRGVPTSP